MTKQEDSGSSEWVCPHGCNLSRTMCKHLDALLPNMGDGRLRRAKDTNASVDFIRVNHPQFSLPEFEQLMRNYGFYEEWDLDLLKAKYFYGQSVRQIANDFSYCSFKTVARRLKALHALLEERGFEQERS